MSNIGVDMSRCVHVSTATAPGYPLTRDPECPFQCCREERVCCGCCQGAKPLCRPGNRRPWKDENPKKN